MYNKYVFHLQAEILKNFNVIGVQSQCARLLRAQHLHTPQPDYGLQRNDAEFSEAMCFNIWSCPWLHATLKECLNTIEQFERKGAP